jgi:Flp pilus assembly protein TadG
MTRRRRTATQEQGQAMVEFALVLPVLCVLLLAVIQFGIVFNNYITLTDAVRAGARTGAVSRLATRPADVAEAKVRASASALAGTDLRVTVDSTWAAGTDVTVSATYPWDISLLGWVVGGGSLKSKTVERVE